MSRTGGRRAARLSGAGPLAAASIWGGMYVVSKWGFGTVPPLALVFLRVVLGAAVLLVVVRAVTPERDFSRRDWLEFAGLGVWLAVSLSSQFVGTDLTNASQGSVVTILTPVFTLGMGVALLDESLSSRKLGGTALALGGTAVLLSGQYDLTAVAAANALGVGLLVVASATFAGYTVYGAPLVRRYSALEAATYATLLSLPLFGLGALAEYLLWDASVAAAEPTLPVIGAVLYLGVVSTALAWVLWYEGLTELDAGTVAVFFFAQPAVGVALGALLLGEPVGPLFVVGAAVTATGVYLVSTARS